MNSSDNLPTVANDPFLRSFDAELSRANRDSVRSVSSCASGSAWIPGGEDCASGGRKEG
jgi:hypothetical protein